MRETRGLRWARRIGLLALTAIVGVPLYVMLETSLTPLRDLHVAFAWIPRHVTVAPYLHMWQTVPLGRYLRNSVIVAVCATVLALLVAVPAAYSLARLRPRGSRAVAVGLLMTQAAPGMLFLIPLFLIYGEIGRRTGVELIGSLPGLVITDLTFALPLTIWLLAVHFAALPREIGEAAQVDGAGPLRVLWSVAVPLARPGIAAAGIFAFLLAWGEVLFASVLAVEGTQTLPVGLHSYATQTTVYWNQLTAAAITTSLPVLVTFLAVRRLLEREVSAATARRAVPPRDQ